ncbi:unnamed protein product, partial [Ectocarpus sp. 8 AP-2014]
AHKPLAVPADATAAVVGRATIRPWEGRKPFTHNPPADIHQQRKEELQQEGVSPPLSARGQQQLQGLQAVYRTHTHHLQRPELFCNNSRKGGNHGHRNHHASIHAVLQEEVLESAREGRQEQR